MTTVPALRCPECGAETRRSWQDDGTQVLVCTDYDCPRVIAYVVSLPDKKATNAEGVVTLDTRSEHVISYALLTVGTDRNESLTMRNYCADTLDSIGHPLSAEEVRQSLASVKA